MIREPKKVAAPGFEPGRRGSDLGPMHLFFWGGRNRGDRLTSLPKQVVGGRNRLPKILKELHILLGCTFLFLLEGGGRNRGDRLTYPNPYKDTSCRWTRPLRNPPSREDNSDASARVFTFFTLSPPRFLRVWNQTEVETRTTKSLLRGSNPGGGDPASGRCIFCLGGDSAQLSGPAYSPSETR